MRNWIAIFSLTHRLEIKHPFLFFFFFNTLLLLLLVILPTLLPVLLALERKTQPDFDTTFGAAFCKMRHAFL